MSLHRPALSGLEQRVYARLRALGLAPGAAILVGFSGGPDSLALAALLARLASRLGLRLVALHVDHALRAESGAEERWAAELAAALGVPYQYRRVDHVRARHPGVGLEEAARRERYLAFADARQDVGAAVVALGHHQDDQAETALLHLLRGAGLTGAVGMAEQAVLPVPWWDHAVAEDLVVWRPFLTEPKSLVRAYAAALGLVPNADPTNTDPSLRRNAIRHQILPALDAITPGATAAIARFAGLARDDDALLEDLSRARLAHVIDEHGDVLAQALAREPIPIQRRIVRRWLVDQTGYRSLTADRTDSILHLAARGVGGRHVEVGGGLVVAARGGRLRAGSLGDLRARDRAAFPGPLFAPGAPPVTVGRPGEVHVGSWRIDVGGDEVPSEELVLRRPQAGDEWAVSGRKLAEWIATKRVSPFVRGDLVCLARDRRVYWVAGLTSPDGEGPGPKVARRVGDRELSNGDDD